MQRKGLFFKVDIIVLGMREEGRGVIRTLISDLPYPELTLSDIPQGTNAFT